LTEENGGEFHVDHFERLTIGWPIQYGLLCEPCLTTEKGKGTGSVYVVGDGKAKKVDVQVGNDNGSLDEGTPVKGEMKKVAQSGL
jgi:hypothetical protein